MQKTRQAKWSTIVALHQKAPKIAQALGGDKAVAAAKGLRRMKLEGAAVAAASLLTARGLEAKTATRIMAKTKLAAAAAEAHAVRVDRGRPVAIVAVLLAAARALLAPEATAAEIGAVEIPSLRAFHPLA
jgi:hypothetical protein